ncbi:MAG: LCP family protein [Clostridia bacterium]|nr:LCP family protein [Clostridia bacterium]
MSIWLKRLIALSLVICLCFGTVALADDTDELLFEDLSEEELEDESEASALFNLDSTAAAAAEEIEMEVDDTVDPDNLELNPNLPDHVVNILLIGIDTRDTSLDAGRDGNQHGDVQIILSINKKDGSVKLTSIQRDSYVTIPGYKNKNRINLAYSRGGGALAMRTVNHNFQMNIQYYCTINFFGLASIIDAIGGIDIEMTKVEASAINAYLRKHPPAYDNTKGTGYKRVPLERKAGVQHLDGVQAVMYARLREIDNDFARTVRQRNLLELLKKVMQDMDMDRLFDLVDACVPYVRTNMNAATMLELGMGILGSGIVQKAQSGQPLMEQFRLPMGDGKEKAWSYRDIAISDRTTISVVYISDKNLQKNTEALHNFIYGAYYPAN